LGVVLVQQGRVDEGIASLRDALEIDPGNTMARQTLEQILARQGRADQASLQQHP
jgi:protein involved in temperature-dependent protein secretion